MPYMGPVWHWSWAALVPTETLGVTQESELRIRLSTRAPSSRAHTCPTVIALEAWPLAVQRTLGASQIKPTASPIAHSCFYITQMHESWEILCTKSNPSHS